MSTHELLLQTMRQVIREAGIAEVAAAGEFSLATEKPILFPGGVYGFAARLADAERQYLCEEAQVRGLCRLTDIADFRPIEGDFFPIYWGKDKFLGARPHQRLGNPEGTGVIRLRTYEALRDKTIAVVSLTVADYVRAEAALQRRYPDLLKTTTEKFPE
jgi:hypothetical protein